MDKQFDGEFETYWRAHEAQLLRCAPLQLREERENNGKMNTAGDWLLFVLPVVATVGFMNAGWLHNEMVNLLAGLGVGAAAFVLTMFVKPYVTGKRSIVDINADIKRHFYRMYQEQGIEGLEQMVGRG